MRTMTDTATRSPALVLIQQQIIDVPQQKVIDRNVVIDMLLDLQLSLTHLETGEPAPRP